MGTQPEPGGSGERRDLVGASPPSGPTTTVHLHLPPDSAGAGELGGAHPGDVGDHETGPVEQLRQADDLVDGRDPRAPALHRRLPRDHPQAVDRSP